MLVTHKQSSLLIKRSMIIEKAYKIGSQNAAIAKMQFLMQFVLT